MKCSNCGRELDKGDIFCSECGTRVESDTCDTQINDCTSSKKTVESGYKKTRKEYQKTMRQIMIIVDEGEQFYEKGDYDAALRSFSKAIKLNPDYKKSYYLSGCCYYEKKDYGTAIWAFNRVIELDPDNPDNYIQRALSYNAAGYAEKAQKDIYRALELDPHNEEARDLLRKLH